MHGSTLAPSPPAEAEAKLPETEDAETLENEAPPSKRKRGPAAGSKATLEVHPSGPRGRTRQTRSSAATKAPIVTTARAQKKKKEEQQEEEPPRGGGGGGGGGGGSSPDLVPQAEQRDTSRTPEQEADTAASVVRPITDTQPPPSDDVTPPPDTPTLKRPGRKPKGFLSFLSDKPANPSGNPGSKVKPSARVKPPSCRAAAAARKPLLLDRGDRGAVREMPLKDISVVTERKPPTAAAAAATTTTTAPVARPSLAARAGLAEPRPSTSGRTAELRLRLRRWARCESCSKARPLAASVESMLTSAGLHQADGGGAQTHGPPPALGVVRRVSL
ncbi:hypothetical protein CRUP_001795 [Coryphaenoides rupestris]|nr:hypothetical protein CRUP_001795 [Coryphaenoides rupestris]